MSVRITNIKIVMPLGESMISIVRSNKRIMIDKSKHFRKSLGGYGPKQKVAYDFPQASDQEIKRLSQKIARENKKIERKQLLVFSIIISLILLVLFCLR
ncbi:hypothetical protein RM697_11890 [Ichthyenterobacterium sp. W332]|uniref:Uncharacterized protein n=1 Tax=Microcosmobacter mediterraneus TaxID=3075607 RepID=A0ABU2YMG5_9FLAO|nr:hypothetical protein [Ichthyenterobacterium sp. W332]MDT0559357.1 hypothetical protein [Ichthyenterobacterium sp. W332]